MLLRACARYVQALLLAACCSWSSAAAGLACSEEVGSMEAGPGQQLAQLRLGTPGQLCLLHHLHVHVWLRLVDRPLSGAASHGRPSLTSAGQLASLQSLLAGHDALGTL